MMSEAVHISPGIYLLAEKNPGKPVDEGCAIIHSLKWCLLPQKEVGKTTQYIREGEGNKGRARCL